MSPTYVLSALAVGALWVVPLLAIILPYRRQDRRRPSNVVTFPRRDATVTRIHTERSAS